MIIAITGTPGVGKSAVANILAKRLKAEILDLEEIARKRKIIIEYDVHSNSMVIDEFKISEAIRKEIEKGKDYIVPSHLSHFIKPKLISFLIILRANPNIIEKRLKERKYNPTKIAENVMCEFLDACLIESLEFGHKKHLHEIDTSKKKPMEMD